MWWSEQNEDGCGRCELSEGGCGGCELRMGVVDVN